MFLEFLVFSKKANKQREDKNEKNYLHGKAHNMQSKSFWVFFLVRKIIKREKKTKKKWEIFLGFPKFFKHTRRKRKNKTNMDIQWKRMNTENLYEVRERECNVGEKYILPQA